MNESRLRSHSHNQQCDGEMSEVIMSTRASKIILVLLLLLSVPEADAKKKEVLPALEWATPTGSGFHSGVPRLSV